MTFDPRKLGAKCDECPCNGRKPVPSSGTKSPRLVVIGEAPGKSEVAEGQSFWGPTGAMMKRQLQQNHGIHPRALHKMNAVACFVSKDMTEKQRNQAVACCRPRVLNELKKLPKVPTLVMGTLAYRSVIESGRSISDWWGAYYTAIDGRKAWAAHHPSFLFHKPAYFGLWNEVVRRCLKDEQFRPWPEFHQELTPEVIEQILQADMVGYDVETAGPPWTNFLCFSFATDDMMVSVLASPANLQELKKLWANPDICWVGQAGNHDRMTNWFNGMPAFQAGSYHDTFVAHCILYPQILHNLGDIAAQYFIVPRWKSSFGASAEEEKGMAKFAKADIDERAFYNAADSWLTQQCMKVMLGQLAGDPVKEALYEDARHQYNISLRMQRAGIMVDLERLDQKEKENLEAIEKRKKILKKLAPEVENPNSHDQVRAFLKTRIEWDVRTDTGQLSTSAGVLSDLLSKTQGDTKKFITQLLEFRHFNQIQNLYIKPLKEMRDETHSSV